MTIKELEQKVSEINKRQDLSQMSRDTIEGIYSLLELGYEADARAAYMELIIFM